MNASVESGRLFPPFDRPVEPGGYAWWYVDALSDDGRYGLTVIAFVGSVFSPYYARARRRGGGRADPLRHCSVNVVLFGDAGKYWAMTERGSAERSPGRLLVGSSALSWDGAALTIDIDELTNPLPRRLRGRITVTPQMLSPQMYYLDAERQQQWWPVAPCSRVDVALETPALCWAGEAYLDANAGGGPIAEPFLSWNWSRARMPDGATAVLYDVVRRAGRERYSLALRFDHRDGATPFTPPPRVTLPKTGWRVARGTQSEAGARVVKTVEDTPFYTRSLVEQTLLGERVTAVHESISLDRFRSPLVQFMLPWRMPRRG